MVSVLIPNYNHARFLTQRIESVLNQTWQEFEVVILDDCSTDESRNIIESYRGHAKIVSIIYNDHNSGSTFHQWQKGIESTKGDFVWIAESDDWCEPSFLETVMQGLLSDPQCVVAYCQSYCVEDSNRIKWQSSHPCLEEYMDGQSFIKNFMVKNTAIFNASMAVWRKSAYEKITSDFTNYRYCGDWLFWIELCQHGKVFISGKLLNFFRTHATDVSTGMSSSGNGLKEEITLFKHLRSKNWITKKEFDAVIIHKYIEYRLTKGSLSIEKQAELEKMLTNDTEILLGRLDRFYFGFYLRHGIRNFLSRLTR